MLRARQKTVSTCNVYNMIEKCVVNMVHIKMTFVVVIFHVLSSIIHLGMFFMDLQAYAQDRFFIVSDTDLEYTKKYVYLSY